LALLVVGVIGGVASKYHFTRVDLVYIPPGEFTMGEPGFNRKEGDDLREHNVKITRGFQLMKYEVTQELWGQVMDSNPSDSDYMGESLLGDALPVQRVSWVSAVIFANSLSKQKGLEQCYDISGDSVKWPKGLDCKGYRLPTEAEWEYAARAGKSTRWMESDKESDICRYSNVLTETSMNKFGLSLETPPCEDGYSALSPVGSFQPNSWGLYDMTGNIEEWVWDWFDPDYYKDSPGIDPTGPRECASQGCQRVVRGGNFTSTSWGVFLDGRGRSDPFGGSWDQGIRLAITSD